MKSHPAARAALVALVLAGAALAGRGASAHSASDAYLTLDTDRQATVHGQWDIALRDLDFAIGLDDSGDGEITWGEVRHHEAAIAAYALARLKLQGDGRPCTLHLIRQRIDGHADGAYVALFFDARCAGARSHLTLDYRMFFDIDPSHRAILVARHGQEMATAVLSPQTARIDLPLAAAEPAGPPR